MLVLTVVFTTIVAYSIILFTDKSNSKFKQHIEIISEHGKSESLLVEAQDDQLNHLRALVTEYLTKLDTNNSVNIDGNTLNVQVLSNVLISVKNRTTSTCSKWREQHNDLYNRVQSPSQFYTGKRKYFLSVVGLIINSDEQKHSFSVKEIREWLRYLFYAGVEHAYIYDGSQLKSGSQENGLADYIKQGLLTYHDFTEYLPYYNYGTQFLAYQHSIDYYKEESVWHLQLDIDEYPFSPSDYEPGFLKRNLESTCKPITDCEQVLMRCYYMIGQPNPNATRVTQRSFSINPDAPSLPARGKPLYNPRKVLARNHENTLLQGVTVWAAEHNLILLHYWANRDTNSQTLPDIRMLHVSPFIDLCDISKLPKTNSVPYKDFI